MADSASSAPIIFFDTVFSLVWILFGGRLDQDGRQ